MKKEFVSLITCFLKNKDYLSALNTWKSMHISKQNLFKSFLFILVQVFKSIPLPLTHYTKTYKK